MSTDHSLYVIIEGEPFLERAIAYRDARRTCEQLWWGFAKDVGAIAIGIEARGLVFQDRIPPAQWLAPKGPHGYSRPKKTARELLARFQDLPAYPRSYDVFGDSVIWDIVYESPYGDGAYGIGNFVFGPFIGWTTTTFVARIADAAAAARDHLANNPKDSITNGADKWTLPAGLRRISKAESDLIFAQARVDKERKDAVAEQPAEAVSRSNA